MSDRARTPRRSTAQLVKDLNARAVKVAADDPNTAQYLKMAASRLQAQEASLRELIVWRGHARRLTTALHNHTHPQE